MLQKPRRRKSHKKKLAVYILFLIIFGFVIFLINSFFLIGKPLFISPIGENHSDVKRVEKILKNSDILFSQMQVLSDSSYSFFIPNNGQVRLSSRKDINGQIASLQRILRELTIEGKSFKNIDFRFEKPIVSF